RPGVLTLKAAGNLSLDQDLSDGFMALDPKAFDLAALPGIDESSRYMAVKDRLQPGRSWSFNLVAGGDVSIGHNASARTGTGDIVIEAGRDFRLADDTASVYTAGRPTDTQRYGSLRDGFVAFQFYGEYPVEGGDVAITAGRDVLGARTGQFFDGWLVRAGDWSRDGNHQGQTPTAWAVALGQADRKYDGQPLESSVFRQNIGALGGGDVKVSAGRDIVDLSAVTPTTGKQKGALSQPDKPGNLDFATNVVQVSGGGNLSIEAGGDVRGGVFYSAAGTGMVRAGGSVGASDAGGIGPVVGLGDSSFRVEARQDVTLGAALNPTVIAGKEDGGLFFTYSGRSALQLSSLAGDVDIQNDLNGVVDAVNRLRDVSDRLQFPGATFDALSVYPASLDVAALQGDIAIDRSLVMYPSAQGQLSLMAGQNIVSGANGANVNVTQSDADPTLLPNVAFPTSSYEDATQRLQPFGDVNLIHAQLPLHWGDAVPVRIYADQGSLKPQDPLLFVLPKSAKVRVGQDMVDVSFKIQHADSAISEVEAGRDIRFTSPRNGQGNLVNLTREIEVSGPGELQVFAGRNIDLGASEGIYTLGNTLNRALAERGADISVFAGQSTPPQFDAFARHYLDESTDYRDAVTDYMRERSGNEALDAGVALAQFKSLPEEQRRSFLLDVFFSELRASASAAAKEGAAGYQRGYDAIARLFPDQKDYAGDLKLFFSKVHTIDGGNIDLLVPGGSINAGLAVAFSGEKPASDLGIVAQRDGQVNAFLNGDFQVNQSRVFAMDGGDITLWSAAGNIDAGRGAKAAIAAPPPLITFDAQGNLQVEFPPVVSGSGIRTAASSEGVNPGDVYLAAPKGVVDAGEAGIGGNNVTIAATAVIGASNISVSGVSTGVPTATVAAPVTPAGAANAAASAATAAQQNASGDGSGKDSGQTMAKSAQLTPLNVEVIGFGECSVGDVREGKAGCG
ncbi:MAG: hemagglutinin-related protein, partial [Proteobacteria bacterium]|nr:hemagglutinin-related protein [Pseudomonadota bacterium]